MSRKVPKRCFKIIGEVVDVFVCGHDRFPHLTRIGWRTPRVRPVIQLYRSISAQEAYQKLACREEDPIRHPARKRHVLHALIMSMNDAVISDVSSLLTDLAFIDERSRGSTA